MSAVYAYIGALVLIIAGFALALPADKKWGWLLVAAGAYWAWYTAGSQGLISPPPWP